MKIKACTFVLFLCIGLFILIIYLDEPSKEHPVKQANAEMKESPISEQHDQKTEEHDQSTDVTEVTIEDLHNLIVHGKDTAKNKIKDISLYDNAAGDKLDGPTFMWTNDPKYTVYYNTDMSREQALTELNKLLPKLGSKVKYTELNRRKIKQLYDIIEYHNRKEEMKKAKSTDIHAGPVTLGADDKPYFDLGEDENKISARERIASIVDDLRFYCANGRIDIQEARQLFEVIHTKLMTKEEVSYRIAAAYCSIVNNDPETLKNMSSEELKKKCQFIYDTILKIQGHDAEFLGTYIRNLLKVPVLLEDANGLSEKDVEELQTLFDKLSKKPKSIKK